MAREMVAYADSLAQVRRAFSKTQAEVGEGLGMPLNAVSQLEKRKDMRLSTLARYVDALGGRFRIGAEPGGRGVKGAAAEILVAAAQPSYNSVIALSMSSHLARWNQ